MGEALAASGRQVTAGGVRLFVREAGVGRPLVLIHGYGVSHLEYRRVFDALAAGAHVIAMDLPGHGESQAPADYAYTYDAFAETVAKMIEALGWQRVSVVGHSMGAGVALRLATGHPALVERLTLCDAACYPVRLPLAGRLALLPWVGRLIFRNFYGPRDLRRYFVKRVYYDPTALEEALVEYYWLRLTERRDAAYRALCTVAASGGLSDLPGKVACPTLVVWGEHDRIFPPDHGRRLAAEIRGATLDVFSTCGHSPPEEQPARFASAVLGFVQ